MLPLKIFVYSKQHSAHSEHRDQRIRYKRLKTIDIINRQVQKVAVVAYRRWSFPRGSNCKALTGKVLVFWISGRQWEVVAHGGSTVYITIM